jgi:UDP-3-O-acyl-N-acetylglucosamine deacetylase
VSARERTGVGGGCEIDADETSRHALLDALGALALLPARIAGHYLEHNADPSLRCGLLKALLADRGSWGLTGIGFDALDASAPIALRRAG